MRVRGSPFQRSFLATFAPWSGGQVADLHSPGADGSRDEGRLGSEREGLQLQLGRLALSDILSFRDIHSARTSCALQVGQAASRRCFRG